MASQYRISIINNSGNAQRYAIFNAAPEMLGGPRPEIWSAALYTATLHPSNQAESRIPSDWIAVQGTSRGRAGPNIPVSVNSVVPVTLAQRPGSGSSLTYSAQGQMPVLSRQGAPSNGPQDTFTLQTQSDFTVEAAQTGNWLVGIGKQGRDKGTSYFTPDPSQTYNIKPINKYLVAVGDYPEGTLVDLRRLRGPVEVDFTAPGASSSVSVINMPNGRLEIQRA